MTTNERPSPLRSWLARHKPDRVRVTLRNGDQREIPKPSTTRGQWTQLEHAITLLSPSYLEAFRGTECVASRALDGEDDADPIAAPVSENPMAALVQVMPTIVQLIVDAGDASAMRHQAAYELAFQKQNELVKILADRLGGLERAWHKMILDKAAEQSGGGDSNDQAAMSLLGNIIRGNGGANGASGSAPEGTPRDD